MVLPKILASSFPCGADESSKRSAILDFMLISRNDLVKEFKIRALQESKHVMLRYLYLSKRLKLDVIEIKNYPEARSLLDFW